MTQTAPRPRRSADEAPDPAEVYLEVQRSAAFRVVRERYRRFVVPACAAFLAWYFGYLLLAVYAPGPMGLRLLGPVNLAMALFFGQFAAAGLITAAYVRDAHRNRDRAALDLRWETQERTR
ncbi:DUF485 domain-containing protein [Phaeacidiphilus oryzae]|uniref:DUF485 domain-containing protein n=1 Tax=Phaeacidiphilus oryzae TaxID=348818 RepID=UPI00068A329A|nr:DUF485 domain-containing protein [Phaeacidiphilus oryzae]